MLQKLDNTSRKCGLKMNMRQTKIMAGTTRTTKAVYVNGIQLDQVEEYVYIGQRFTLTEKNKTIRRIKAGWQALGTHSTTMNGTLPTCLKGKVFN